MRSLTAKDVMNPQVLTVSPDATVEELSVFLVENQISGAPVVDAHGKLLGMASLTDIAESEPLRDETEAPAGGRRRHGAGLRGLSSRRADLLVRDIMTPAAFAVPENTPVAQLARTMVAGRIHRLLVIRDHRTVGIVTSLDLLRVLFEAPLFGVPPASVGG